MHEKETRRAGCLAVEPLLASFASGALDEASEHLVRDHLVSCPHCRALQLESDPSVLFLELRRHPLPDGFLDGLARGVRDRLESKPDRLPLFDWLAAFGPRRAAYVAAPLMTLLLLGTLFIIRPNTPRFRGSSGPGHGGGASPIEVPQGPGSPGEPGVGLKGTHPVVPMTPAAGLSGAPPLLEEIGSPGARVYRFGVDDGGEESPIYFVVDESINI